MSSAARRARIEQRHKSNRERRKHAAFTQRRRNVVIAGAVAAIGVIAIIAFVFTRAPASHPAESSINLPAVVAADVAYMASIPNDGRVLGDPNAPVTLVEWADYQCPFCGTFSREIMPRIIQDYVVTGKVKIDFRDLPFLDTTSGYGESDMAAEAAACAADQGKFWEMHDTIFANQFGENAGAYSKERLIAMAGHAGLDVDQFTECFEKRTHKEDVAAMQAEAIELGITSTPTLVINGKTVRYSGKYEDLAAQIDAALAG
jgi:protein-disulfide isomerase